MLNIYRDKNYLNIKKTVDLAFFLSIAIVLSVFESFIPISFVLPGVKLGLTNIILVLLITKYSFKELLIFQVIKIVITTFILGVFSTFMFSLSGGLLALVLMFFAKKIFKSKITIYTVSMIGGIAHNVGQTLFAMWFLNAYELIFYIPALVVVGCITGFILGYIIEKLAIQLEGVINYDRYKKIFS